MLFLVNCVSASLSSRLMCVQPLLWEDKYASERDESEWNNFSAAVCVVALISCRRRLVAAQLLSIRSIPPQHTAVEIDVGRTQASGDGIIAAQSNDKSAASICHCYGQLAQSERRTRVVCSRLFCGFISLTLRAAEFQEPHHTRLPTSNLHGCLHRLRRKFPLCLATAPATN